MIAFSPKSDYNKKDIASQKNKTAAPPFCSNDQGKDDFNHEASKQNWLFQPSRIRHGSGRVSSRIGKYLAISLSGSQIRRRDLPAGLSGLSRYLRLCPDDNRNCNRQKNRKECHSRLQSRQPKIFVPGLHCLSSSDSDFPLLLCDRGMDCQVYDGLFYRTGTYSRRRRLFFQLHFWHSTAHCIPCNFPLLYGIGRSDRGAKGRRKGQQNSHACPDSAVAGNGNLCIDFGWCNGWFCLLHQAELL